MDATSLEILHDFFPLFRVYKDGRIERLMGKDVVPASTDHDTGVKSKDIEIVPDQNLSARLYLPKNASPTHKLPLLIYFHGGAFVIESAFSPSYHNHLNLLVAEANVVVVSVNYRLAPEYPLPIAYEDSWDALKWVVSHREGEGRESWLNEYADFDRVYLGGDSAGGNIAHNIAVRVGVEKLEKGVKITGVFLNCPYFGGKEAIGEEVAKIHIKSFVDKLWHFVYPTCSGSDDPFFNPATHSELSSLGCRKVLVYVAEKDILKDRGWNYKEVLCKSGWNGVVEVIEVQGEEHVFNLFSPTSDKTIAMVKKLASFMNE